MLWALGTANEHVAIKPGAADTARSVIEGIWWTARAVGVLDIDLTSAPTAGSSAYTGETDTMTRYGKGSMCDYIIEAMSGPGLSANVLPSHGTQEEFFSRKFTVPNPDGH